MKKEGEYHFAMCRGEWYIWQVKEVYEHGYCSAKVDEEDSYRSPYDAYVRVCELNGKQPVARENFKWGR
jgi:hypothetical protein